MPRNLPRLLSAAVLGAAVSLGATGCGLIGGADTKAACDNIQKEIDNVGKTGMKQISDPKGMEKTYTDGAEKIRGYGKEAGGDVEDAANDVAKALDDLGKAVGAQTGKQPDQQPLITAGAKLKAACG